MDLLSLAIVFAAALVGFNIGANSASNAIGVIVGSNLLSFKKAAFLVSFFMLAGAFLQGGQVIETVGSGIIPPGGADGASHFESDPWLVLASLSAVIIFVGSATYFSFPVATSHTMIGAIVGSLFAAGALSEVDQGLILKILASWMITPAFAIAAAYLIYRYVTIPASSRMDFLSFNRVFRILLLLGAVFLSYSLGANNIGNAVGPVLASGALESQFMAVFVVGLFMGFGASAFSGGVVDTIGKKITNLGSAMAFTVLLASALVIYIFTLLGIPISSTQAVVGGVMGVGFTKGVNTVNLRTIEYIFLGWVLTPLVSGAIAAIAYSLFSSI